MGKVDEVFEELRKYVTTMGAAGMNWTQFKFALANLIKAEVPNPGCPSPSDEFCVVKDLGRWEQDFIWREAVDRVLGIGKEEEPKP